MLFPDRLPEITGIAAGKLPEALGKMIGRAVGKLPSDLLDWKIRFDQQVAGPLHPDAPEIFHG